MSNPYLIKEFGVFLRDDFIYYFLERANGDKACYVTECTTFDEALEKAKKHRDKINASTQPK